MPTREQVIQNAKAYLNIQSWTPLEGRDKVTAGIGRRRQTFHSAFVRSVETNTLTSLREYSEFPYVFGRFDPKDQTCEERSKILTVSAFLNLMDDEKSDDCPGGWDINTGKGTASFGYPQKLAGIDCSEYVLRCWGFTCKCMNNSCYGTDKLSNLCLKIKKAELQKGDILLKKKQHEDDYGHVRLFLCWGGDSKKPLSRAWIYEAIGIPDGQPENFKKRPFSIDDKCGCVGKWSREWDDQYEPWSPFPQFTDATETYDTSDRASVEKGVSVNVTGTSKFGAIIVFSLSINDRVAFWIPSSKRDSRNRCCTKVELVRPDNLLKKGESYRVEVCADNWVLGNIFRDCYEWTLEVK